MGKGRLSVFLVRITWANTDSGDAKNNTPTQQQISPMTRRASSASCSYLVYTVQPSMKHETIKNCRTTIRLFTENVK